MNQSVLKSFIPHVVAIISFVIVSCIFFYPQLQNKVMEQSDTMVFRGMAQEIKDYKKETGKNSLWTNSMFGGMPTYQIASPQPNNIFSHIEKVMYLGFDRPIGYFIYGMISFYILMLIMGVNPWLAIGSSIAFSLMTNNLILFEAGHNTKVRAIMSSPIIIAGMLAISQKRYRIGGLIYLLGMGLNLNANHYQMTYYLGLSLLILVGIEIFRNVKLKDFKHIGISAAILILGILLAFGTGASKLLPTYEYSKDTMRGEPILKTSGVPTSSSETDGLDYDYAMSWSNGASDLIASFIPGVVGGSSGESVSQNSAFAKELKRRGARQSNLRAPLYFGALPFTSGPIYFGMVVFFLMVLSIFLTKGHLRWWVLASVVLMMMLSMGKNLDWFNHAFFNNVPMYNKFRTPNSILSVTSAIIAFLSFYGLNTMLENKNKEALIKPLWIITGIFSLICLYFAFIAPSSLSLVGLSDANYEQQGLDPKIFESDRKSLMRSDSLRSLAFLLLSAGTLWAFLKNKVGKTVTIALIVLLAVLDLFFVGKRYINENKFVSKRKLEARFAPRPVDELIKKDNDPHYRVYDASISTFVSSSSSYHHKTIGGNHAAKLQRIQDVIDRHITQNNQRVLNMLNTKYYIVPDGQGGQRQQLNTTALGNAWFVNEIKIVSNANEEIDALTSFDPSGTAIVHQEFSDYLQGTQLEKSGGIRLTGYAPDELNYSSNSTSEQLAVFSEIWYGPNKGWQAYVDDEAVDHIRVNYLLRALKIPAGAHEIKFVFDPPVYKAGNRISLISSAICILLLLVYVFFEWKSRRSTIDT